MNVIKDYIFPLLLMLSLCFSVNNALGKELNIYYSNDMHGIVEPCG